MNPKFVVEMTGLPNQWHGAAFFKTRSKAWQYMRKNMKTYPTWSWRITYYPAGAPSDIH